ncbi:recombinase family protein [Microbacteriaceae bacterium VKM Ac-2855]|nr:recombinase family protein [Microbacteriaceae bacterium VKM Ac-2855]
MRWETLFDHMERAHIAIDRTTPVAHNQAQKERKGLMSTRIGAHARISLDMEGEGLGVERQHEDNRAVAAARGWEIVEVYTDNSLSAYKKNVVRPEFERLVADLEAGVIDGVVAYDLDRLWRKPSDLERVIDLYDTEHRRPFATVQGDYDLSTSDGRTMARILVAFANKSSSDTSRRLKRKNLQLAQAGRARSGPQPYGYMVDQTVVDPVEGPIVHDMGMKLLAGLLHRDRRQPQQSRHQA